MSRVADDDRRGWGRVPRSGQAAISTGHNRMLLKSISDALLIPDTGEPARMGAVSVALASVPWPMKNSGISYQKNVFEMLRATARSGRLSACPVLRQAMPDQHWRRQGTARPASKLCVMSAPMGAKMYNLSYKFDLADALRMLRRRNTLPNIVRKRLP